MSTTHAPVLHTPHISFLVDSQKDVRRFNFFLNSAQYRRKRPIILSWYPKLGEQIKNHRHDEEEKIVREAVLELYRRYHERIPEIVDDTKRDFSESAPAFDALARYMGVRQLSERSYIAVPTFLPFSPLDNNLFYFSIASDIAGKKRKPFRTVAIGIHEISHFLFYEELAAWSKTSGIVLNDPSIHYFKEALAAAVMNQHEFRRFFDYPELFSSETYRGNPELHDLSIAQGVDSMNIVTFFEKELLHAPDGYHVGMGRILELFADNANAFIEKWALWNQMSRDNNELVKKYREPIRFA